MKIQVRSLVSLACITIILVTLFLAFFPSPMKQIEEKTVQFASVGGGREFILACDEKIGDCYVVPGKWVSPKHFLVVGKPIKIDR